jgi:hypothetical protein
MVTTVSNLTRGSGNNEATTIVSRGLPEGVKKIYNPIILPLLFGFVGIKKLAYPIVLLILFICNSRSIGVGAKTIKVLNALGYGCSDVQANNTVFGREDGSTYKCREFFEVTYPELECSYKGLLKYGKYDGRGEFYVKDELVYDGDWKAGKAHGSGIRNYNDESTYVGNWKDGEKHGEGIMTYSNGSTYIGEWKEDRMSGKGKMTFPNGSTLSGNWQDGKMQGKGKMTFEDATTVTVHSQDNMIDGGCLIYNEDGSFYAGNSEDEKKHGKGVMFNENGTVYDGNWKEGFEHGEGKMTYSNGSIYSGNWKDGVQDGEGTMTCPNGSTYTGTWENGIMDGKGTITCPNGSTLSGNWAEGKRNGRGVMIYPDGATEVGNWKDDVKHGEVTSTYPDKMEVVFEYDNGELKTSNITDAHKERFFRMLVSDSSIKGGFWSRTTHQILSDLLGEINSTVSCEDQMIPLVAEFKTINEYLESKAGSDPCVLEVSRGGHAFLMKIEKPDEDNVQLVLIDSSSSNSLTDESQKGQSCRIFKLTDQGNLKPLLRDLQAKKNIKEFTECLQKSSSVTEEPTKRPALQATQKIGNCSVKCWLALLRYELWKNHSADWESRWHTLKANLFTKASEFFETRLEGETDPIRKKCMERSIQLANDKITKREQKLERLTTEAGS